MARASLMLMVRLWSRDIRVIVYYCDKDKSVEASLIASSPQLSSLGSLGSAKFVLCDSAVPSSLLKVGARCSPQATDTDEKKN